MAGALGFERVGSEAEENPLQGILTPKQPIFKASDDRTTCRLLRVLTVNPLLLQRIHSGCRASPGCSNWKLRDPGEGPVDAIDGSRSSPYEEE